MDQRPPETQDAGGSAPETSPTNRAMTGFHQDEEGDWVAELACGHNQHVRHRPPFQVREWAVDQAGRDSRLGAPLHCPLCERAEMPETVRSVRSTPVWDEHSMPAGLRRRHRVAAATWGRIRVQSGRLRFRAATEPPIDVELDAGSTQPIPPEVEHEVEPIGSVQFSVEFLAVTREPAPEGGEPACWAALTCPECGAITTDGHHKPGCSRNAV